MQLKNFFFFLKKKNPILNPQEKWKTSVVTEQLILKLSIL